MNLPIFFPFLFQLNKLETNLGFQFIKVVFFYLQFLSLEEVDVTESSATNANSDSI
jgi:hypothetical protein